MRIRDGVWGIAALAGAGVVSSAGCGDGGGGGSKKPALTAVVPPTGNLAGGETITLTGKRFLEGAVVTIGGSPCSSAVVVDEETITCTLPPGTTPGAVPVVVETSKGSDTADDLFAYASAITSVFPPRIASRMRLEVRGDRFDDGAVTVTVGGVPCTGVTIADDERVRCTTGTLPATGAPATATVAVTNALGTSTYPAPVGGSLFAADGKAGTVGNLYYVDVNTAQVTTAASLSVALTGMTILDDGRLLGVEATSRGTVGLIIGSAHLLAVDLFTGAHEVLGKTVGTDGVMHDQIAGLAFHDGTLFGWSEETDDPVAIEESGTVHRLSAGDHPTDGTSNWTYGSGLAIDANGTAWFTGGGAASFAEPYNRLYQVSLATGLVSTGATLVFSDDTYDAINALAFVEGTLYGIANDDSNVNTVGAKLVSIDTTTGAITLVGDLPPWVDALASTRR